MYRRKSDNMWCQKVPTGNGYRVVYGRTQRELKEKLAYRKAAVPTFREVAEEWADAHLDSFSPASARGYRGAVRRAADALGSIPVDSVRAVDITRFLAIVTQKRGMAEKTAGTQLSVIRQIMRYAVTEKGYCDYNPANDVKIPSGLPKHARQLPSAEDIQKVKDNPEGYGLFALIALYTGLRRGEILALRRDDIDTDRRLIYVTKALRIDNSSVSLKLPKTESGVRVVGIPDGLLPYLKNLPEGFIFNKNGKPLNENEARHRWKVYAKAHGISAMPHQFRHAYTTAIIEAGISPVDAQRLLGHADFQTTMNIYNHFREEKAADIARKTLQIEPK